jgi:predicted DNA-binding transcriptional regulator AlpA
MARAAFERVVAARAAAVGAVPSAATSPETGKRSLSSLRPCPRRGLSRPEASMYVGVGVTRFDEMVSTGKMPKPKKIGNRKLWDIVALDLHFDRLPDDEGPSDRTWDDI